MISGRGGRGGGLGGPEDRVDLHLVDLRIQDPQPAASGAEHRILLGDLLNPGHQPLQLVQIG
jgi:hypothetical protein